VELTEIQPLDLDLIVGNQTIRLKYDPAKFTPEYRLALERIAKGGDAKTHDADSKLVADLVLEWDVTMKGQPYPPTYENLVKMPVFVLAAVSVGLLEDVGKLALGKLKA